MTALPTEKPTIGVPIVARSTWTHWIKWVVALAPIAYLWFRLINNLRPEWTTNPQYSYGWVVPFLCIGLLLRRCSKAEIAKAESSQRQKLKAEILKAEMGEQGEEVSGQTSAVSGQWSVVSGQTSAVSGQRSVVLIFLLPRFPVFANAANRGGDARMAAHPMGARIRGPSG